MTTVPVRLEPVGESVDLYLAAIPRIGEHVHWKGADYVVKRVIHVVSETPYHVRVVLAP